jgi:hypothetical protein
MDALKDSLKIRYDAVLQADTNSRFYQNLHLYFDFIVKTLALNELLEASENEYRAKHIAIWERDHKLTDEEADEREERTLRLERFNLYAVGCGIYVNIYLPIEDYKNSIHESEFEQDPVAVLMIKGIKRINPEYEKRNPFKWGKNNIRRLNRRYEGKRGEYEKELKNFHLMLLDAVEKAPVQIIELVQKPSLPKIPLKFNFHTGDFALYGVGGNLSPISQEFKLLETLLSSPDYQAEYLVLLQAAYPHLNEVTKTNKQLLYQIVQGIKEKLDTPDVIKNVPRVGYRLYFKDEKEKAEQT